MRELGEYVRFLGEGVDACGFDHDVADSQGEYDKEIPNYYNRNPRAEIWMELRLAPGRS